MVDQSKIINLGKVKKQQKSSKISFIEQILGRLEKKLLISNWFI